MADTPKPLTNIDIPKAVAHAVKLASEHVGPELVADHRAEAWHILGRVLRDDAQAEAFGANVVKALGGSGIKVEQASAKIAGGRVIMGFFPVDQLSALHER